MTDAATMSLPRFPFDNTFARDLEGCYVHCEPAAVPAPSLLALNEALAAELGLSGAALASPGGVAVLAGNAVPAGAEPLAQAYAGHQFGSFNPSLGDVRAILLGEVVDRFGQRRDIQFKGSGRTPFSRRGDGKAAVGPMLREYILGEAMYALGVPTTRALAVVATGEDVHRDSALPGAVLTRVATSHVRVGTFQYFASRGAGDNLRRVADYSIARHFPHAAAACNPYVAFLDAVVDAQASLIAKWVLVGFIHGVMNTDNMAISGETIDYGPCAFIDAYDPATVYSSIDHGGRYAFGNQPAIARWNLARLAEALLPLIDEDSDAAVRTATEIVTGFADRYQGYWLDGMRAKLGLTGTEVGDETLVTDLLALLQAERVDYFRFFRWLAEGRAGALFAASEGFEAWQARWLERMGGDVATRAAAMHAVNPVYVPRNHLVEAALSAAVEGDLDPFEQLVDVLADPYTERAGLDGYAAPPPAGFGRNYRTFCGT